jgi:hypothetical protein
MPKISPKLVPFSEISQATKNAKNDHADTATWVHNQCWAWEDGDALVVVTGRCPNTSCWCIVRFGGLVSVVEAPSIKAALLQLGFEMA